MGTPGFKSAKAMEFVGDRISSLPDELLRRVMSFLPVTDAVRTCLLSPRWRHLWTTVPCVNIDAKGFTTQRKFINFVTTFLLRRGCAPLESFMLCADEPPIVLENFCDTANLWISHALWCKVQTLSIVHHDDSDSLTTFQLDHHPFTSNSKYLKRLHLCYVNINSPLLNILMSGCSALEDLEMTTCEIFATELSSATLKNLSIENVLFQENEGHEDFHDIVINMPSLVSLRFRLFFNPKPILVGMQSLVTATISLGKLCPVKLRDARDILGALSHAKNLELFLSNVEEDHSLQNDMQLGQMVFTNLRTLSLNNWFLHDNCKVLLSMLEHSRNLEILTLKLRDGFPSADVEMEPPCEGTTTPLSCEKLKKIEISCPKGHKGVGMLVTILYANIISPPEIRIKPFSGCLWYE